MRKIEIDFAIDVKLTDDEVRTIVDWTQDICDSRCPKDHAFWVFGMGSKPQFSKADAAFLGKTADPDAPDSGEPTWDDSIFMIETSARPLYPNEIEERQNRPPPKRKPTDYLKILHEACWDLRCVNVPTGGDDYDISWLVIEYHMAEPHERQIGQGKTPEEAINAALQLAEEIAEQAQGEPA